MPETVYRLSRLARKILYLLTDRAERQPDGTKQTKISVAKIGRAVKVSNRSVSRCLRRLEALGYITTYVTLSEHGDYNANTYVVHPIDAKLASHLEEARVEGVEEAPHRQLVDIVRGTETSA